MGKRSSSTRAKHVFVRPEYDGGVVPSVQKVLDLIDTTEPAWPSIAAALREFAAAGIPIDIHSAPMAVLLGRQRWAAICQDSSAPVQPTLAAGSGSIVYYIRRGTLIKVGTTVDPRQRFRDLLPDEILAVEPGDRSRERLRHRQFKHLRTNGEHFRDAPELRDHIASLLKAYGEPDPEWPTSSTLRNRKKAVWQLSAPSSTETLTATQAEADLGINENTLRGWVHRGRLQAAGRDELRRHTFYREHLIILRDSTRKRLVQHF